MLRSVIVSVCCARRVRVGRAQRVPPRSAKGSRWESRSGYARCPRPTLISFVLAALLLPLTAAAQAAEEAADSASRRLPGLRGVAVDDAEAAAAGIHKLASKRLTLYTDLALDDEVRRLPEVFDQAFPQWCACFRVSPAEHAKWRMTGFIMKDKARFQKTGLLPGELPPFLHGFSRNDELWLYEQPSEYYRRHLLLHEGTHGFMNTLLGGCGPPWYMEGMAELLATHRLREGRLTLNWMPASREDVPELGRIRIIKDECAAHRAMSLDGVVNLAAPAYLRNEPYAWSWALAAMLDGDPRCRDRFRQLFRVIPEGDVSAEFRRLFRADWRDISEQWQVYIAGLEYNDDIPRTAIDFSPGQPMPAAGAIVKVAADRGWQNSGLRLEAGVGYRLTASGRYQVAKTTQIWWSEPGGVSIRYYRGRPLGVLLAAVRPDEPADGAPSALLQPIVVGLGVSLSPRQSGTLFLKINESAGELNDTAGAARVEVRREE